jgi:hypothetical protein
MHDENGVTTLCAPSEEVPLCTLRGLSVDRHQHVSTAHGTAAWASSAKHVPMDGFWRLQAVDRQSVAAENSVFRR